MSVMDRLERKMRFLSRFNIMIVLIGAYALGYILSMTAPAVLNYLAFDPPSILKGQVWRLFTFVVSPDSSSFFMALITCFIYFSISRTLEQVVGTFRVNFFMISGILLLDIFGFLFYALFPVPTCYYASMLSPYYLYAMLFVLFALMFPEARFLFMFIFPIKGRWMIFITMGMYLLNIVQAFSHGFSGYAWILIFMVAAAILTLFLFLTFCGYSFKRRNQAAQRFKRMGSPGTSRSGFRTSNTRQSTEGRSASYRHKCEICGRTNITHPELDFRYCSKCYGNHEYCMEHLYTHIHVKSPDDIAGNFQS